MNPCAICDQPAWGTLDNLPLCPRCHHRQLLPAPTVSAPSRLGPSLTVPGRNRRRRRETRMMVEALADALARRKAS